MISRDPEFEGKVSRIKEVLERPGGKLVIFEDEKASLVAKEQEGYLWGDKRRVIESPQEVKGKLELFAAYIPEREEVRYRTYLRRTSKEFIDFMGYLRRRYPERGLIFIQDNRSIHKAKSVWEALERLGGVELMFLPTNAAWLNPLESIFSALQRGCLSGVRFTSVEEIRGRVKGFFKRKNKKGVKINHRFWPKIPSPVLAGCT